MRNLFKGKSRDRRGDELVTVAIAWSDTMANSWAELLRNNEIPALVKNGGRGFSLGAPAVGIQSYILVPHSKHEQAVSLLEPYEEPGNLQLNKGTS